MIWTVLLLAVVGTHLPFVNEQVLEARAGQAQGQGRQFHALRACVFLTLALPGSVWRYLRRRGRT